MVQEHALNLPYVTLVELSGFFFELCMNRRRIGGRAHVGADDSGGRKSTAREVSGVL